MIAVGLDPSLACSGVAIAHGTDVTTRRVVSPSLGKSLLARRNRIRRAVEGILAPIPPRVDVTVIEIPNSTKQTGAHGERMALYWFLVDQLLARGPVVGVAPSSRAKLATGNGRASKADVVTATRAAFPDTHIPDDNVADAIALMWAGARWAGAETPTYLPGQHEAFARLAWPTRTTTPTH